MDRLAILAALATVIGGAYMLLRAQQQTEGSGGGTITTDNTTEGSIMDFSGLASQVESAVAPAQDNPQGLSQAGLDALTQREGFSPTPYTDYKGSSIGYGHLIKAGESLTYVTRDQAAQLLAGDVAWAVAAVQNNIAVPLSQPQFDALVSFAYNVGAGAFARSTLVRKINAGDPTASAEFDRWIYAGGRVSPALVDRRQSERNQYESGMA